MVRPSGTPTVRGGGAKPSTYIYLNLIYILSGSELKLSDIGRS